VHPDSAELLARAQTLETWAEIDARPEDLFEKMQHTADCDRMRTLSQHFRARAASAPPQLLRHRGNTHQRNTAMAISATAERIFGVPLRGMAGKLAALACGAAPPEKPGCVVPFKRS